MSFGAKAKRLLQGSSSSIGGTDLRHGGLSTKPIPDAILPRQN
ncbi:hypothetical protein ACPCXF_08390 [Lysinibacillus agricola]